LPDTVCQSSPVREKRLGDMMEVYLRERQSLCLVIFIMDIRRDPNADDLSLRDGWIITAFLIYIFSPSPTNYPTTRR
jgi:GTP-binding protein EngB required for normal cell division